MTAARGCPAEVAPHDARAIAVARLGAEQRPPRARAAQIAARRRASCATARASAPRQRGSAASGAPLDVVRPHDRARRRPQPPRHDGVAAQQRAQQRALDLTAALALRDDRVVARSRRVVSTTNASLQPHFTPSVGRPRPQSPSGRPRAAIAIERAAHLGRQEQPRARRIARVEPDRRRRARATRRRATGAAPRRASRRSRRSERAATITDGYTAASNAQGASDQSSSRSSRASRASSARVPPPRASATASPARAARRRRSARRARGSARRTARRDRPARRNPARAGALGAGRPGRVAEDGEPLAQRGARRRRGCCAAEPMADCRRRAPNPPRACTCPKCDAKAKGSAPAAAMRWRSRRSAAARRRSASESPRLSRGRAAARRRTGHGSAAR